MIVVLDASVAVKWFLRGNPDEQQTEQALRVLEQSALGFLSMVQPGYFVAEVAAAPGKSGGYCLAALAADKPARRPSK